MGHWQKGNVHTKQMCFIFDALSENVRLSCVSFLNVCWFQFAPPSEHSASGHFISSVAMVAPFLKLFFQQALSLLYNRSLGQQNQRSKMIYKKRSNPSQVCIAKHVSFLSHCLDGTKSGGQGPPFKTCTNTNPNANSRTKRKEH